MKKQIPGLLILSFLIGLTTVSFIHAAKREIYVLCRQIVSPQVLDHISVKKKKLNDGVLLTITSKDEPRLKGLRGIIENCMKAASTLESDAKFKYELLYRKGVTCTITDVKNGFQLQMISTDPEMAKILKKVYIPKRRYGSDVTGSIESEGIEGSEDEIQ